MVARRAATRRPERLRTHEQSSQKSVGRAKGGRRCAMHGGAPFSFDVVVDFGIPGLRLDTSFRGQSSPPAWSMLHGVQQNVIGVAGVADPVANGGLGLQDPFCAATDSTKSAGCWSGEHVNGRS